METWIRLRQLIHICWRWFCIVFKWRKGDFVERCFAGNWMRFWIRVDWLISLKLSLQCRCVFDGSASSFALVFWTHIPDMTLSLSTTVQSMNQTYCIQPSPQHTHFFIIILCRHLLYYFSARNNFQSKKIQFFPKQMLSTYLLTHTILSLLTSTGRKSKNQKKNPIKPHREPSSTIAFVFLLCPTHKTLTFQIYILKSQKNFP